VLGFDPTTKPVTINRFQENDATTIAAGDQSSAIAPFSVAQWVAQGNKMVADKRAGYFEGTLTGASSDDAPVSGTAGTYAPAFLDTFVGAHYMVDTRSPSYGAALNAVGFDGTGPSALCHRDLASTLQKFGFKPLPVSGGVFCRRSDLK
jgi:phosphate transport system substrate-binding protein